MLLRVSLVAALITGNLAHFELSEPSIICNLLFLIDLFDLSAFNRFLANLITLFKY